MDTNQNQLTQEKNIKHSPQMPALFAWPIKSMPIKIQHRIIELALNELFQQGMHDGELNFLKQHTIDVLIHDAHISFALTIEQQRIKVTSRQPKADLSLSTDVYTLLQLISQQEDADSLFFSRRLDSQGNTELGLYVKNFLSGLDPDESKFMALGMSLSQGLLQLINFKIKCFN